MGKRKRIAFIVNSLSPGGAERVISTLANGLVDYYDVSIIIFFKGESFYFLDDKIDFDYCFEEMITPSGLLESLKFNYKLYRKLKRILKEKDIKVAIGFMPIANVLTVAVSKRIGIPCIISERNNPENYNLSFFWKYTRKYLYKYTNILTVQTNLIKGSCAKIVPKEKIVILPNPIAVELTNKRNNKEKKENIVLSVGRLNKQKNQTMLVEAFAEANNKNWKLYIVGEGEERPVVEKLITKLGLNNKISLLGLQSNVHEYYNKSKIFAFSSDYEGFPNALIEAMHFGLPSISTNCPSGPSELIQHNENGFLTPVGDKEEFSKYLNELMHSENLREKFSERAKEVTNQFMATNVIDSWKKNIDNV